MRWVVRTNEVARAVIVRLSATFALAENDRLVFRLVELDELPLDDQPASVLDS